MLDKNGHFLKKMYEFFGQNEWVGQNLLCRLKMASMSKNSNNANNSLCLKSSLNLKKGPAGQNQHSMPFEALNANVGI